MPISAQVKKLLGPNAARLGQNGCNGWSLARPASRREGPWQWTWNSERSAETDLLEMMSHSDGGARHYWRSIAAGGLDNVWPHTARAGRGRSRTAQKLLLGMSHGEPISVPSHSAGYGDVSC